MKLRGCGLELQTWPDWALPHINPPPCSIVWSIFKPPKRTRNLRMAQHIPAADDKKKLAWSKFLQNAYLKTQLVEYLTFKRHCLHSCDLSNVSILRCQTSKQEEPKWAGLHLPGLRTRTAAWRRTPALHSPSAMRFLSQLRGKMANTRLCTGQSKHEDSV